MQPARTRSRLPRLRANNEFPSLSAPAIESLDDFIIAFAPCPIGQARSYRTLHFHSSKEGTPRPFHGQRRPAELQGAETSHLLPPELGSLKPWKLSGTSKGPQGRPGTNASLQHRTGLD